jgi:two-component system chemotaxis response regulator CheY
MNILIVDDSKAMRHIIVRSLRDIGVANTTFLEASDGSEALKVIRDAHPELVISDFNMPGMSGVDLLRAMRADGIATCFGFVTSEASAQLKKEAMEAGAHFIATKPFTAASLSQTLQPVLADLGCRTLGAEDELPAAYTNADLKLPRAPQVAGLLKELLRRAVTASPTPAIPLPPRIGHVIAEYSRVDDGALVACGLFDISSAVRVGAALSLIPSGVVAEAIKDRQVTDIVAENLHEVLNVMARLFGGAGDSGVHLSRVHRHDEPLSPEFSARLPKPKARIDICVEIAGYGKGNLTLLSFQ